MFDSTLLWAAATALTFALFSIRAVRRSRRTVAQIAARRAAEDCQ